MLTYPLQMHKKACGQLRLETDSSTKNADVRTQRADWGTGTTAQPQSISAVPNLCSAQSRSVQPQCTPRIVQPKSIPAAVPNPTVSLQPLLETLYSSYNPVNLYPL